jgi:hypothetical protein
MKRLILLALLTPAALLLAEGAQDFVGNWKSDPGTPTMTRTLGVDGNSIIMLELQPGRNNGPTMTIIRLYPFDGSEAHMESGIWKGATASGKIEGNVLTVDTTAANGTKYHDVWTLSDDKKHYTNEMTITPPAQAANAPAGGEKKGGRGGPRTVKFGFTKVE